MVRGTGRITQEDKTTGTCLITSTGVHMGRGTGGFTLGGKIPCACLIMSPTGLGMVRGTCRIIREDKTTSACLITSKGVYMSRDTG